MYFEPCFKEELEKMLNHPASALSVALALYLGCLNKVSQTSWLKQQKFISHSPGDRKSKVKMSAGLVSSEASLLGL